jgi:hypothetical protein
MMLRMFDDRRDCAPFAPQSNCFGEVGAFRREHQRGTLMHITRLLSCGLALLGILGTWGIALTEAELLDRIVAVLHEDVILLSEVREQTVQPAARAVANLRSGPTLEDETLRYMIERRLVAREVQYLAAPRDTDGARALAIRYVVAAYHSQDQPAFAQALQTAAVTDEALDEELLLYMKGVDYIRRRYRFSEDIDDADTVFRLFTEWLAELHAQAVIQFL